MGYIKRLKDNELVGGTSETFVYPITATTAVYHDGEPLSDVITRMDVNNMPPLISNEDVTLQYGEKSTIAYINEQEITVTMPPEPEIPEPDPVNIVNYNPQLEFGQQAVVGQIEGTDLTVRMPSAPQSESVSVENKNANLQYGSTATIATIDGIDINVSLPEPPPSEVSVDAIDIDVFSWGTNDEYNNWSLKEKPAGGYSFLYALGLSLHYNGNGVFTRIHLRGDFDVNTNFEGEHPEIEALDTSNCEIYGHSHTLGLYRYVNGVWTKSILPFKSKYVRIEGLRIMKLPNQKFGAKTDSDGGHIKILYQSDMTYVIFNKVEFLNFPTCNSVPPGTTSQSNDAGILYPYPFTFMEIVGTNNSTAWSFKLEMNECQINVHPFRFSYSDIANPYENPILFANYRECYAKVFVRNSIGSINVKIYNEAASVGKTSNTETNVSYRPMTGCDKLAVICNQGTVVQHDTTLYSDGTMKLCVSRDSELFDDSQNGLVDRLNKTRVYYGIPTDSTLKIASQVNISQQTQDTIPQGIIVMWSGYNANIPTGWALCNGQTVNGVKTPDLRGKFIYASEEDRQGELGAPVEGSAWHTGEPSVSTYKTTLTIKNTDLPQHAHKISATSGNFAIASSHGLEEVGDGNHGAHAWDSGSMEYEKIYATQVNEGCGATSKTFTITIPKPSFYTLAFIMKVK